MDICGLSPFRDETAKGWGTQVLFTLESKMLECPFLIRAILKQLLKTFSPAKDDFAGLKNIY